jgi:hypothetical protein
MRRGIRAFLGVAAAALVMVGCGDDGGGPAPPTITVHPRSRRVIEGETATFTVSATGSATLAYQWKKDGADIPGATSPGYATPPTVLADNGAKFTCVVTNAVGSVESNAATLAVRRTPCQARLPSCLAHCLYPYPHPGIRPRCRLS